ncbi:MAG: malate synthase A, partial [Candidatus Obscuribacter sp.]|nr:malate synthase A [Candidatus Obscuribacter sp.]
MVRPRGLHLLERHLLRRETGFQPVFSTWTSTSSTMPMNRSNGAALPYFYLPKLEVKEEARLWNLMFSNFSQDY